MMTTATLQDALNLEAVIANLTADSKAGAIKKLCLALINDLPNKHRQEAIAALEKRETLGTTAIGNGVAIPHAKLEGLDSIRLGFARHQGLDFGAEDGQPVTLVFMILAPAGQPGVHLQLLARIARIVESDDCRQALLDAQSTGELIQALTDRDDQTNA